MFNFCFTARLLLALSSSLFVLSCAQTSKPTKQEQQALAAQGNASYETFAARSDYKKTYDLYKNESLLNKSAKTKRIVVNLGDQRAQYLVDGAVALDFPVCTGVRAHPTPTGPFSITEKKVDHRSNLYGNYSLAEAEKAKEAGTFVGTSMPYWQRLTGCGIGLHVGKVRRNPASHGCIRVPRNVGSLLYSKTSVGTRVDIIRYKGDIPVLRMPPPSKFKVTAAKGVKSKEVAPKVDEKENLNKQGDATAATQQLLPTEVEAPIEAPAIQEPSKAPEVKAVSPELPLPPTAPKSSALDPSGPGI